MIIEVDGQFFDPEKILFIGNYYVLLEPYADGVKNRINFSKKLTNKKDVADAINQAIYDTANKYKLKNYINNL